MSDVVTAPDSIQPATISFSSLYEKAMAHDAGNDAVAAPVAAPPAHIPGIDVPGLSAPATPDPVTPVVAAPAPVASPAEVKILDLPDDALVRVKIDGKLEPVAVKDYLEGISREAVFTKRMQSLAEQRKAAESELATRYSQIQQEAQAVEAAKAQFAEQMRAQMATPAQPQTPSKAFDPGEIATMGDVQATLQAEIAKIQSESKAQQEQFAKALGEASQQVQREAAQQRDAHAFTEGMTQMWAKPEYAVLKRVLPYSEESLRYQVAAMDPKSIPEALQFTEQVAKGWLDTMKAEMVETAKRHEVAKAQAKLEPPTGSAPPPVTQYKPGSFFGKDGKQNWDALRARAETMLGS